MTPVKSYVFFSIEFLVWNDYFYQILQFSLRWIIELKYYYLYLFYPLGSKVFLSTFFVSYYFIFIFWISWYKFSNLLYSHIHQHDKDYIIIRYSSGILAIDFKLFIVHRISHPVSGVSVLFAEVSISINYWKWWNRFLVCSGADGRIHHLTAVVDGRLLSQRR